MHIQLKKVKKKKMIMPYRIAENARISKTFEQFSHNLHSEYKTLIVYVFISCYIFIRTFVKLLFNKFRPLIWGKM